MAHHQLLDLIFRYFQTRDSTTIVGDEPLRLARQALDDVPDAPTLLVVGLLHLCRHAATGAEQERDAARTLCAAVGADGPDLERLDADVAAAVLAQSATVRAARQLTAYHRTGDPHILQAAVDGFRQAVRLSPPAIRTVPDPCRTSGMR